MGERVVMGLLGVLAIVAGFGLADTLWTSPLDEPLPPSARVTPRGLPRAKVEAPRPSEDEVAATSAPEARGPGPWAEGPDGALGVTLASTAPASPGVDGGQPAGGGGAVRVALGGPGAAADEVDATPSRAPSPAAAAVYDRAEAARLAEGQEDPEGHEALPPAPMLSRSVDMYAGRWAWMADHVEDAALQVQVEALLGEALARMEDIEDRIHAGELGPTEAFRELGEVERDLQAALAASLPDDVEQRLTAVARQR